MTGIWFYLAILIATTAPAALAQSSVVPTQSNPTASNSSTKMVTTEAWNRRLQELVQSAVTNAKNWPSARDYRIGPNDQLLINVLEAPDLSNAFRVAADGEVSMPLLGTIKAAGLTPRELELVLEALLRRTYMKDPHVSVTVTEMQSHSISVLGAVKNPGVFQIRGTKTLLEMLSMAGGLAPDAGDTILVMRGASAEFARDNDYQIQAVKVGATQASEGVHEVARSSDKTSNGNTIEVSLKQLLDTGDSKYNVLIYPGDIVKVKTAGIVYVIGHVNRPGGFPVKDNEHLTVLQAIALGSGLSEDASKSEVKIIRIAQNGQQVELPIRLDKILNGKSPDLPLRAKDILFVPKNGAKSAVRSMLRTLSQVVVWRSIP